MSHAANVSVVNGQIQVDVNPLAPGRSNRVLTWTLTTPGYQFTSNGIDIAGNTGQFTNGNSSGGGKTFQWTDANSDRNAYNYTINVVQSNQPHGILRLDPTIQNGGLNE